MQVLYSDAQIFVCVKEAGVASQSPGMPEQIAAYLRETEGVDAPYIGVVHRLDREVAGVMVFARTEAAAAALSRQITAGEMKKEYVALLCGDVPDSGELTDLLYHDQRTNKTFVVDRMRRGVREARLAYEVIQRTEVDGAPRALVHIQLFTGRTHQIRVQFGSRRYPVVGDARYGGGKGKPHLFSCALTLRHPTSGKEMRFTASPDWAKDFNNQD